MRKWRSWMYVEWLPWSLSDVLCCPPGGGLFDWHTRLKLATLDQHAPALPLALWLDVTSPLCQSACSHFSLPFASIRWPHSICCGQGTQDAWTSKTKSFWTLKTFLKLSKRLLSKVKKNQNKTEKPFYKSITSMLMSKCGFYWFSFWFYLLVMVWHYCPGLVWDVFWLREDKLQLSPWSFYAIPLMCFKLVRNMKGCKNIWFNDKLIMSPTFIFHINFFFLHLHLF